MSAVESIKNKISKVKVDVEEKVTILGEKSEVCVTVIEKAAKKSLSEMEEKLNYLGERSGDCVNLIERVAKKSVGQLKATLYVQNKSCENIAASISQPESVDEAKKQSKEKKTIEGNAREKGDAIRGEI